MYHQWYTSLVRKNKRIKNMLKFFSINAVMGTEGPFPGCKAQLGHDTDFSPHLVPRS
jgi:hypothetical protein